VSFPIHIDKPRKVVTVFSVDDMLALRDFLKNPEVYTLRLAPKVSEGKPAKFPDAKGDKGPQA
jgi:hypothetical protein